VTTIKRYCAACGVHAGDSLDLARALRIVVTSKGRDVDWFNELDIADPMTMKSFLARAGLARSAAPRDLRTFLSVQRFIGKPALLSAVEQSLAL
jgi:hypothetical protein